jgi:hypothetical protein
MIAKPALGRRLSLVDSGWSKALLDMLAVAGALVTVGVIAWGISTGRFGVPGGDVVNYLAAGSRLTDGGVVYTGAWNVPGTVYYAPPIIVAFSGLALLPNMLVWIALCALDLAGLRYLAGSWRAAGLWGLVPLTGFELVGGNPVFAIAAAILLAARGSAGPLALASLVKLGPVFALPLRGIRPFVIWLLVALVITIPWLNLWPQWIAFLVAAPIGGAWPVIVPLIVRAPIAVILLALRRDGTRMLAACLLTPGFYLVTAYATIILAIRLLGDYLASRSPAPPEAVPMAPGSAGT